MDTAIPTSAGLNKVITFLLCDVPTENEHIVSFKGVTFNMSGGGERLLVQVICHLVGLQ